MKPRHPNAFTLIETIAAMVVLSIIASSASLLVGRIGMSFRDRAAHDQLHIEASVALDRMVREIRSIKGSDDGSGFGPEITQAETSLMHWGTGRLIDLSGSDLRLNADGTNTDTLANDVTALTFDFLDESGSTLMVMGQVPLPFPIDIQRISISLTLERNGCTETLHTLVFLRALTDPAAG